MPKNYIKRLKVKIEKEQQFQFRIGKQSFHDHPNDSGNRLINPARSLNVVIASTYFERKMHKDS